MDQPREATVVWTACIISTVALIAATLALADISHGENDVRLEWHVVQVAFLIMLVFHVLSWRMLRRGRNRATHLD
jgi:uncharacterized membrane protein